MKTKKGFTLVEVVVALGILAMALAAAVTLIITALNLALVSRDNTEATALMQKGLALGEVTCNSCSTIAPTGYSPTAGTAVTLDSSGNEGGSDAAIRYDYTDSGKTNHIYFDNAFATIGTDPYKIDNTNFTKIISVVTWKFRNQDYRITSSQYIRKKS
jgi:prepilin-type N-terminal cleavage/methylation domain-containing protein